MAALLALSLHYSALSQTVQDHLVVTGPSVVFFEPTDSERDSIIRIDGVEVARLFDDFDYYAGKAGAYLKSKKIPLLTTSRPVIVVRFGQKSTRSVKRSEVPDILGVILTDGVQEPQLISGVATDEELIAEIRGYFRLK